MKLIKKTAAVVCAASLALSAFALPEALNITGNDMAIIAQAGGGGDEDILWYNCFNYTKLNENEVKIYSFYNTQYYIDNYNDGKCDYWNPDNGFLVFPTYIEGRKVTEIENGDLYDWDKGASEETQIKKVYIPSTVTKIVNLGKVHYYADDDEFLEELLWKPVDGFTIYTPKGSAAEKYAKENGFDVVNTNKYEESAPASSNDISGSVVKVGNKVYTGKKLKPAVTVTIGDKTLENGRDYTVSYKNNKKVGKATVTITGTGDYTGTKKASFIIKPKKVTVSSAKSTKTKTVKIKWKKSAGGVTGYQVQTALNKKFTKSKTSYKVKKASTVSKTIKKLKKGKTYYVRVRAYKTVGKTTYYGKFSTVKKVKCK